VTTLANGTYLGECLVHCDETVTASPEKLTYSLTSKLEDARNPDIHVETAPPPELWEELEGVLDLAAVSALPDRIALPDADDSGGEFLEVSFDGERKRVDFPRGAGRRKWATGLSPGSCRRTSRLKNPRPFVAKGVVSVGGTTRWSLLLRQA
jgi:hypothetical protein